MTYTLAQYAKNEKQPLRKGILLGLAMEGLISDLFSWRGISSMSETGTRYDTVPTPSFIPLDGAITESTVDGHQITHSVYRLAQHIDIPVPLEDMTADLITKPSAIQSKLALKGAAYKINDTFVNGDQATDANSFNGINKLAGNLAAAQTVTLASFIDLTTYSQANSQAFLFGLHQSMSQTSGHLPTAGFANQQLLLRFEEILRRESMFGVDYNWAQAALKVDDPRLSLNTASTKPAFSYRNIPFFDLGFENDQVTNVIGNTYNEGGASSNGTRVFFIKEGEDELEGIQADPLQIRPIGLMEAKDNYRFRLTWSLGLALWGARSIVKFNGFKAA